MKKAAMNAVKAMLNLLKTRYHIKDEILRAILIDPLDTLRLASRLNQDIRLIRYLVEQMQEDQMVTLQATTASPKGEERGRDYRVTILNRGNYFYNFEGGYVRVMWKNRRNACWIWIKIIAAFLNAAAIIYFSYLSVFSEKLN